MKTYLNVFLAASILLALAACSIATTTPTLPTGPGVLGVFAGTTPCSRLTRPLPQIPADSDCNQMNWRIVLYRDPATGEPATYELSSAYGVSKQGTPDLVWGGTHIDMAGTWEIRKGTQSDPAATVYRLDQADPPASVSFVKISDDIIHLLDGDGALVIGNGAWAYTLNRVDPRIPSQADHSADNPPQGPTRPPTPPPPAGESVLGVFDGRTPCDELLLEFTKSSPGCLKIKWRLTLYQDRDTGAPGTFLYMGTSYFTQGTWTILRGTRRDPDAIVYRFDPDHSQESLFLLRVDENHLFMLDQNLDFLVGNVYLSYTLSRTDQTVP
jgi:hypothetical protein